MTTANEHERACKHAQARRAIFAAGSRFSATMLDLQEDMARVQEFTVALRWTSTVEHMEPLQAALSPMIASGEAIMARLTDIQMAVQTMRKLARDKE